MTLEEKVAQLGGLWLSELLSGEGFDDAKARARLGRGAGRVRGRGASPGLGPRRNAERANAIRGVLGAGPRLGIPAIVHEESTGGLCARGATQFPQAIALASTWDLALVEQIG